MDARFASQADAAATATKGFTNLRTSRPARTGLALIGIPSIARKLMSSPYDARCERVRTEAAARTGMKRMRADLDEAIKGFSR